MVKGKLGKTSEKSQNIIKIIVGTKFHLKLTLFEFLDRINNKKCISELKKKEDCHQILHIQIKGALSGLMQLLAIQSPSKMMKNAFYFTSEALLLLKILNFCLDFLVTQQNDLIRKIN